MRKCATCQKRKPFNQFSKSSAKYAMGYQTSCKSCAKAYANRRRSDPEKQAELKAYWAEFRARPGHKQKRRAQKLLFRYGVTLEQYKALFKLQKGRCAICDRTPKKGKPLSVDHDHTTGVVRGLLCDNCNFGIGNLQDSEFLLESALAYIRAHRKE